MLVSSVINSVSFKDLSGSFPNRSNTLYNERKKGGFTVKKYWQQFNNGDTIYLQFASDIIENPILTAYSNGQIDAIVGTLVSSYTGANNRYYFNFEILLDATYQDKKVYFVCTQDTDTLTSEPICISDISEEIARGDLRKIQYANLDNNSFSDSYFIDWTVLDVMYFYVESTDMYTPEGSIDILEDVNSKVNIASKLFRAEVFKTGGIPDYLAEKIIAASLLDVFSINETQYVCNEIGEPEQYGGSTLFQLTLNLTETFTVGLNVDDLGIEQVINPSDVITVKRNVNVTGSGWQVENPEGYMLHSIQIKHNATSAATTAVVTCGTTISGTDIIDSIMGEIPKADYLSVFKNYAPHFLKAITAYNIYFSVSGAGADLTIICNFDTITPNE